MVDNDDCIDTTDDDDKFDPNVCWGTNKAETELEFVDYRDNFLYSCTCHHARDCTEIENIHTH